MNVLDLPSLFFGIYLIIPLVLGSFLLFGLFSNQASLTKARRLAGILLIVDAIFLAVRTTLAAGGLLHNPIFRRDFFILDSTVITLFLLIPYTVIHERYPKWWYFVLTLTPVLLIPVVSITGMESLATWSHLLPIGAAVAVLILSIKAARRADKKLLDAYANPERYEKSWVIYICAAFILVSIASLLRYFIHGNVWYNTAVSLSWSALMVAIYVMLVRQRSTKTTTTTTAKTTPEVSQETKARTNEAIGQALMKCVSKQVYLRKDLSVDMLARECGTNRTYLATYMKENLQQNFYEYINTLRLLHVDELIQDPHLTLEAVALQCGFNSARTMRSTYLKLKGKELTRPTEQSTH